MAVPKILRALNDLDNAGFYDNTEYLGDVRTSATCLNSTFSNGIYSFQGGTNSPTDTSGSYKWSLRVYACEDCSVVEQVAERIVSDNSRIIFFRSYASGAWTSWKSDIATMDAIGANNPNFVPTQPYHPATKKYVDDALASFSTVPFAISATAPTNKNLLWIDSGNGNLMKAYDTATSTWVPISAVYA